MTRPAYKPEPEASIGETPDLLTPIESETWLLNRLIQHGCDPYVIADFPSLGERIRHTIIANGMHTAIVGRRNGRPENYRDCWERMYGLPLEPKAKRKAGGA